MTQNEWLSCTDPEPMLGFLHTTGRATERKLRLFAVACCRRIWHLLTDEGSRHAVEVAEQFADGQVDLDQLQAANVRAGMAREDAVQSLWDRYSGKLPVYRRNWELTQTTHVAVGLTTWHPERQSRWVGIGNIPDAMSSVAWDARRACGMAARRAAAKAAEVEEGRAQADLLRDIFRGPFRSPTIEREWLAWNHSTVSRVAGIDYDEQSLPVGIFKSALAVLADALEEAGCRDPDILAHCRGSADHARGCWVVDLILGKA